MCATREENTGEGVGYIESAKQTLENVAAIKCRVAAEALDFAADALVALAYGEATKHGNEMRGAAEIARQWACEIEKDRDCPTTEHLRIDSVRQS